MIEKVDDLTLVVERLAARYPDHNREEIAVVVTRRWRSFDSATVRAFVPILVAREAAAELRSG